MQSKSIGSTPVCHVYRLGQMDYEQAWSLQDRLAQAIGRGQHPPCLLLLEHPHTYTFGRRGQAENLLWDEPELERRGVRVYWVDRGGDVTYHGPGQLVGYPLLPLAPVGLHPAPGSDHPHLPQADYVGYLRRLENVLILALGHLGVTAFPIEGLTGVWVQQGEAPAKIAAIGVKVDARGVSRHGFALNVNPNMAYWDGIIGCGLKDAAITSLAACLGRPVSMDDAIQSVVAAFGAVFACLMKGDTLPPEFLSGSPPDL